MPLTLRELPIIRPITDLRVNLNDVCAQATETGEPIVLTKNGVASYVLQDSSAYDENARRQRIYLALREAEIEERYRPETASCAEVEQSMREIFESLGVPYEGLGSLASAGSF